MFAFFASNAMYSGATAETCHFSEVVEFSAFLHEKAPGKWEKVTLDGGETKGLH